MSTELFISQLDTFTTAETEALTTWKAGGGRVAATFCHTFPLSLLRGLGFWPMRILKGATLEAENASEQLTRPDVCPYCKSIMGNFLNGTSLHSRVDCVLGLITCDQMRRTLERVATDLHVPVFPVQLPATATEQAEAYFVLGVKKALENLASHYNLTMNIAAIRTDEKARADAAAILAGLMWGASVSPEIIHKLFHAWSWSRPQQYLEFLRGILPAIPTFDPAFKVIVIGSVQCEEDDRFVRILEQFNVGMIPLTCSGLNAVEGFTNLDTVADTGITEALTRSYFHMPSCVRRRPNTEVYDRITLALEKTGARGIMMKTLTFCDLWNTEKERIRRTFPVPLLVTDSGYGDAGDGRLQTRYESFLESLA